MEKEEIKVKVYVSCCLTKAPKRYKAQIEAFIRKLKKVPYIEVLHFVTPLPGEIQSSKKPRDIYQNDIHDCVAIADIIIAEVSRPSFGLGYEVGVAIEHHTIPVIMCMQVNATVSKLAHGAAAHEYNPDALVVCYKSSISELLPELLPKIEEIYTALNAA
jgi:hypothetical protein